MTNATSNRYQSRLFNFVHQQSRRLGDRVEETFRHLQVATTWSLEALLYPVFLLVQKAVESAGRQLNPQQTQKKLHLSAYNPDSPPTTDTPIQRILQSLENLPQTTEDSLNVNKTPLTFLSGKRLAKLFSRFKFVQNSSSTLTYSSPIREKPSSGNIKQLRLPIRGIATQLINRNLVLVTAENQILDILTSQQQEKLQDRIIGEVADYWHYLRLAAVNKETQILPEIEHLLTKLTSKNDGGISVLPASGKELVYPDEILTFIDTSIAKLESNALIPLSRANLTVQQRSREIIEVVQTQLNIFVYGKELTTTNKEIKSDRFQIQAIIEAALNYFFGQPKGKKLDSSPPYSNSISPALPNNSQLPNQDLTAPWLSWGDLFGEFKEVADQIKNPAFKASQSPRYSPKIYNYQNVVTKPASVVKQQKPTTDLKSTQKTSKKAQISQLGKNIGEIAPKQRFQTTEIEAQPDWIETKATSIGYEKHPLEQILAWLDAALLWLEEMFVRLFKSLQQFWVGK